MKNYKSVFLLVTLLILFHSLIFAGGKGEKEKILFGTAKINITPEKPVIMAGYPDRNDPFTGVHDSLYAAAFYFSGEKSKNLLITADLIGFPYDFVEDVKNRISANMNIPQKNIMLVAVHNHGGPVVGRKQPESVNEYTEALKVKLIKLAEEASKQPVPFLMGFGKGSCNLNINRRAEFTKGEIWLGRNPDGPCDHELDVVKFETTDHRLLAVLINWPCHGTATGDSNYKISADWPGSAARYIKDQVGSNVVVGVTAGASGDINPIYGPGNNFREVDAIGYHLGDEAVNVLSGIKTSLVSSLESADTILVFPGKKTSPDRYPRKSYEAGPDTKIKISSFKVGNLYLGGISGELMNEIGVEIKKQSPDGTIIMTHCNGSCGYICTDKSYLEGGYEVMVTKLMPGVEKPLVRDFVSLLRSY